MTPFSPAPPVSDVPPEIAIAEIAVAENAWMILWRTLWLDLPLAWARETDRLLLGWLPPCEAGAGAGDGPAGADPHEPAEAVALGLGCGDYSEDVLGSGRFEPAA
jgi:hypothetical protein